MKLSKVSLRLNSGVRLNQCSVTIPLPGATAVLGTLASGKSSLGEVIAGTVQPDSGSISELPRSVALVSQESQQALYERELYLDDTDFMDRLDDGTTVTQLLAQATADDEAVQQMLTQLQLTAVQDRGYRHLSSGEGRRVVLGQALLRHPELLILDEPFEGLDAVSTALMHEIIAQLVTSGHSVLLLVNHVVDITPCFSRVLVMHDGAIVAEGDGTDEWQSHWAHLRSLHHSQWQLPAQQSAYQLPDWPADKPLLELRDGRVQYDQRCQFNGVDWRLLPGQHTQIVGPNGCGKSTLLNLITGDHPQCYANDLTVFGYQRGQGESIWQIKKHIGMVSGSLHRDYRVDGNALTAVLSGLTDSIGVYRETAKQELHLAQEWLALIGLEAKAKQSFKALSAGEQRLVLIARALIKQPPLLVLDEPTQGLDDFNRFYVLEVIEAILAKGRTTLLFVSHRPDETLACVQHQLMFSPSDAPDCLYHVSANTVLSQAGRGIA